jgi:biopolymer transport protein ExbD
MKLRLPQETTDDIDMTPMIDVVFQLIIFFMVASSFVDEAKVFKVALPKGDAPQTIRMDDARKIIVTADGIVARSEATDRSAHYAALSDMVEDLKVYRQKQLSAGKQAVVVIEGDKDAKYQRIIQVWNAIKSAGIDQVSFQVETGSADQSKATGK